jgi:hypothetical protein
MYYEVASEMFLNGLKSNYEPGLVVHTCNPGYPGGGGREDFLPG